MTSSDSDQTVHAWDEPEGLAPRGTLIVLPGRGEHGGVYERFGRRLAFDAYRVRVLGDAVRDPAVPELAAKLLLDEALAGPKVLVGSDTGALYAAALAAQGAPGLDALILAGLPTGHTPVAGAADWAAELELRTACPTHRGRLDADPGVHRGDLTAPLPDALPAAALDRVTVPVLALHGTDDAVSPLNAARRTYNGFPDVQSVSIAGGRHDVLNDVTHRTVAATVVLFLERLRLSPALPAIAIPETTE
jgi:alpha-beta hydrolase superfamily lysophospholipase